ncbi:hypothetical protein M3Y97_00638300 [Aphelenchoides bicaudatus]|nr:hypothetical protein M3Y97_00638300 [Aphelenchoides bicaudatus]
MFVLARGIEWMVKEYTFLIEVIFLLHCAVCMHAIFILPALYQYHYVFVKNGCRAPKHITLFRNLALTLFLALLVALFAALGINQSMERGRSYYLQMFDDNWFHENESYFLYACDIRDVGTIGYFAGGLTIIALSIGLTSYYAFKARSHHFEDDVEDHRSKVPVTRTLFTRVLIIRTINTWIFALFPISLVASSMIFRFDIEAIGDLVMSPWCFLPTVNAAATLFLIRN